MRKSRIILALAMLTASASALAQQSGEVSIARQLRLKRALTTGADSESLLATLRRNVNSWEKLTPEQQHVARERAYAFRNAPPQQQQAIMSAWAEFLKMDGQQQQRYRQRAEWLQQVMRNLSDEKKAQLLKLTPMERARELMRLKAEMEEQGLITSQPAN